MATLGSPIQINLDKNFVIPRDGQPYLVGQINPDLRLEHLDAFLGQIDQLLKESDPELVTTLANTFANVFAEAAKGIKKHTKSVGCRLSIECTVDPVAKKMVYSFDMVGQLRC